jgi:hypothetical protein
MADLTKKELKLRKKLEKKQRKLEKKLRVLETRLHELVQRGKAAPKARVKAAKHVVAKSKKKRPRAPEKAGSPSATKPAPAANSGERQRNGQENGLAVG